MYGRPLRRQTQRKQRKLRLELTRIQRQLRRRVHREQQLLWQLQQQQAQLQQQQRDQRKLEQEYAHWRHLFWQQQLQQQSLLQQQVHHHLTQRPEQHDWLQQKEQAQLLYAQEDGERQESMQEGEQQVTPQEERERRRETAKGKQEEHGDPELWEDEERQLLQPTGPLSGPFLEDEWIASDFSKHVATQPNTSQQASQASAVAVTARPLISEGSVMAVFPGYPLAPLPKAPAAATAGASEDETAAAGASGAAVGSAATGLEVHAGGASAAASTTTGGGPGLKMPALSRLDSSGNTEGVVTEIATARTGLSPPPPAATASSHPDSRDMLDSSHAAALEHPFVHLPRPAVSTIPATLFVDLRSAASSRRSTRYIVPLLQEAHDLLSLRVLSLTQLRKLARAASSLVEHAMNHQHQDLSKHATSRAVERLALRFLSLDVVVSTFIVLGQTPDRGLWRTFTDAISHSAPPLTVRGSKEGRYTFFSILGQELSGAIQLLKTGRRPSPGKLIKIKRMLFCSVESPMRLKTPDFDRWRKDDCSNNDEH
ncbi:hypothetical protein, conserved [Eimeria brunetti]|uniref:Uncharacterized protein n=1 Tax=Eimeria brunetti TaxID=51314 RepID=U6M246_9EIME|nr:hypothetical protein, conserved [Eimeria brunetti]